MTSGGARVLIADDERHLAALLEQFLASRGHQVTVVQDGRAALDLLRTRPFDVALLDVQMPGLDGLGVLHGVRELSLPPEVVVMTGNAAGDTAVTAMRGGAYDYVAKPYRMAEVELLVRRAAERRALACAAAVLERPDAHAEIVTQHAPLRAQLDRLDRDAEALRGLLMVGEPGTGRASIARRAHARANGAAFATVDCAVLRDRDAAALDRALLSPEVTLFLRNVEHLPVIARDQLVAVLDGAVESRARPPARIFASVTRPLGTAATDALDARLREHVIDVPPLRERTGDVALLAKTFARQTSHTLNPAAVARLEAHTWPGNVAELRLAIEVAAARASHVIRVEDLPTLFASTPIS